MMMDNIKVLLEKYPDKSIDHSFKKNDKRVFKESKFKKIFLVEDGYQL